MEKTEKKKFQMPSSYTVLFIIIIILAILTWLIPAGQYQVNENGQFIAGTYEVIESQPQSIYDVLMSPIRGMIGTDYTNNAIEVALFIWILGGFLAIVDKTGVLDAGIASIIKKFKGKEKLLIPIMMTIFALGGSTYGMAEETIAFLPLLIPVMIGIGFDSLTAVAIIIIGSQVGCLASTVNPFATGNASSIAGISIGEGIIWRLLLLVVLVAVSSLFVYLYASKVEKDPKNSLVYENMEEDKEHFKLPESIPSLTGKEKNVLAAFLATFAIMLVSLIPWGDFGFNGFATLNEWLQKIPFIGPFLLKNALPLGEWYFQEITMLFMAMAVLIGFLYGFSEKDFISTFLAGVKDFTGVALIAAVARGIQVVMDGGMITATILSFGENALAGLSEQMFILLTYIFYLPMSFLMPGTTSLSGATIGLLAPLGEFAGVASHLVITAFQAASGLLNLFTPTSGVIMGALAVARIDITTWWKFIWKLLVIVFVISAAILVLASFF